MLVIWILSPLQLYSQKPVPQTSSAYDEVVDLLSTMTLHTPKPEQSVTHRHGNHGPCGHEIVNPEVVDPANQLIFESHFQELLEHQRDQNKSRGQQVIQIPVVVHVVHQGQEVGEGENISEAQVLSQIQALNDAFNRTPNTRYASTENFAGLNYADLTQVAEIEFVLASVDPEGNPTNGINRVSAVDNYHLIPGFIDDIIKPATIWNPNYYLNFWSCRLLDGFRPNILGYAVFPTMSGLEGLFSINTANTDGIVCDYRTVGSNEYGNFNLTSGYQYGITAVHEVGHFLGLRHIWGDGSESEGCDVDDFVDDTPNAATPSSGCDLLESCGNISLLENYMDYGVDACKNVFTRGQILRMQTVLNNSPRRASLTNSPVLSGMPIPELVLPANDLCSQAVSISCGENVKGTTDNATNKGVFTGLDGRICSGESATQGVWYEFIGTGDQILVSTTEPGTDYDATIHIFTGECNDLECIGAYDDDSPQSLNTGSDIIFLSQSGVSYFIYISGKQGETGNFQLSIDCVNFNDADAPVNDSYKTAQGISCGDVIDGTTNRSAVDAIGSGDCGVDLADKGVWYSYVGTGELVTVSTCSNFTFDTKVAIFNGVESFLGCFAENDNGGGCGEGSEKKFFGKQGEVYYIWIGGDAEGDFAITLTCEPAPEAPINVFFSEQDQIDSFFILYPNTTEIIGDVTISHDGFNKETIIHDLQPLSQMTKVGGNLIIEGNIWDAFASLEGLDQMTEVGGDLVVRDNAALHSITALSNIRSIGGDLIISGFSIPDYNAFSNVISIGGSLEIYGRRIHRGVINDFTAFNELRFLGGDLIISGHYTIDTFYGFESLEEIPGDLLLDNNWSILEKKGITEVQGFSNLNSIGGDFVLSENQYLSGIITMQMLQSIGGDLRIYDNERLVDVMGLNNVQRIGNNLILDDRFNDALKSVIGLNNLQTIGYDLRVQNDSEFDNFNGFVRLDSILGSFKVRFGEITDLSGFNNLKYLGDSLHIYNGLAAGSFDNIFPNLSTVEGSIIFENNLTVTSFSGFDQLTLLGGDLRLNQFNRCITISGFSGLSKIDRSVVIDSSIFLEKLDLLNSVKHVGGDIVILDNGNVTSWSSFSELETLNGSINILESFNNFPDPFTFSLPKLTQINGDLILGDRIGVNTFSIPMLQIIGGEFNIGAFNFDLDTFDLATLEEITGSFLFPLSAITKLDGFNNLTVIGGDFIPSTWLSSISDFSVTEIGGDFVMDTMIFIRDLTAFSSIESVGGSLIVNEVPQIRSLDGLDNISFVGGEVVINGNPLLEDCISICPAINSVQDTSLISIKNNALGCNSFTALYSTCQLTPTIEFDYNDKISLGPNPFTDEVHIAADDISIERIRLINQLGMTKELFLSKSGNHIALDLGSVTPGIYTLAFMLENGRVVTKKVLKQ